MNSFKITGFLFLTLTISSPFRLCAQEPAKQIVNSLNQVIRPLETLNADSNFADLDFLKETLKEKELISLGEASHGTAEVYQYKDRLLRFLVTNMGFKTIAFETDFIAMEIIDDYINGKTDRLGALPGTSIRMSNEAMITWLRNYNQNKAAKDKVHVYGLETRNWRNIIGRVISLNPGMASDDKKLLEKIAARDHLRLDKEGVKAMKMTLMNLEKLDGDAFNKFCIVLLHQMIDGDYGSKSGSRDQYMADNALWLKERSKDQKLVIWAHNGHIAKDELYRYPAMGAHLFRKYGSKYFAIATDFNHGKAYVNVRAADKKTLLGFQAFYYPEVDTDKGYEYYFKQCKFKNFFLDVNTALKNPVLNAFLNQPLEMRMIGALSTPVNTRLSISKNFDLIVFFNKTNSQWD